MKILLDTNAYSAMRKGDERIAGRVKQAELVCMSAVVVGELFYGFRNGSRFEQNWDKLKRFLEQPGVAFLEVTLETADRFGQIATALRRAGRPIPTNDVWIAAHALESRSELISFDPHFGRVQGLLWAPPGRGD